jgi:hypothetical protein
MEIIESISWFVLGFAPTLVLLHMGARKYGKESWSKGVIVQEVL